MSPTRGHNWPFRCLDFYISIILYFYIYIFLYFYISITEKSDTCGVTTDLWDGRGGQGRNNGKTLRTRGHNWPFRCLDKIWQKCYMNFTKLLNGFVKIDTWISLSCYMDLSKLIHGFLQVVTWICQKWYMDFSKLFHVFWNAKSVRISTSILPA